MTDEDPDNAERGEAPDQPDQNVDQRIEPEQVSRRRAEMEPVEEADQDWGTKEG